MMNRAPLALLYINVLIIASCGLIYELLAGTLASYVLGDSVTPVLARHWRLSLGDGGRGVVVAVCQGTCGALFC